MTAEYQLLSAKLDLVLSELAELKEKPIAGLRQSEFAKKIGRSRRTVARMVADGRIRLVKGVVPQSEAKRFLS